jgi:hypothetical protein
MVHWDRSSIALVRWFWISNKESPFLVSEMNQACRVYTNAAKLYSGGHSFPFTVKTIIAPHSTVNNLFYVKPQLPIKFSVQKIRMEQKVNSRGMEEPSLLLAPWFMRYFVFALPTLMNSASTCMMQTSRVTDSTEKHKH